MSKYVLNKTLVRTSNNYKINDIEIDMDIPKISNINEFKIHCSEPEKISINKEFKNDFNSRIGLDFDKYYNISIVVNERVSLQDPVIIEYNFDEDNNVLIDEINIELKKESSAEFIIIFRSNNCSFHNFKQVTVANENSRSNICIINLLNNESKSFISIENCMKEKSQVEYNFIDLGGNLRVSNYFATLDGIGCENNFNNIYIADNSDRIDMNYYIKNNSEKVISNINVEGSLSGNSYKSLKCAIDFLEGCSGSIGDEKENCILLSNDCKSSSLPLLLCHEEKVQATHSVYTGKIDQSKLFYLMSKGINENIAKKLIISANFSKTLNKIPNEEIQSEIVDIIDKRIV